MNSQIERIQLQHPEQTLDTLSFCQSTPDNLRAWLNQHDKNSLSYSSQLHSALVEISHLKTSSVNRWELAELLRPEVYQLIGRILHDCKDQQVNPGSINQPAQLLMSLADCYKIIISQVISTSMQATMDSFAASIHRSMTELAQTLYQFPGNKNSEGLWHEMHQLFQLAIRSDLTNYTLTDKTVIKTRQLSISDVYKRALLLSKAEGFSFYEIKLINKALCLWVPHTRLTSSDKSSSYFFVDLYSDSGLKLKSPSEHSKNSHYLSLDVRVLIAHLKKLKSNSTPQKTSVLPAQLISLLLNAWGAPSQRVFKRYPNDTQCQVHLGFKAIYQALSTHQNRDKSVLSETVENSNFGSEDIWASAYDTGPVSNISLNLAADSIEFCSSRIHSDTVFQAIKAKAVNSSASGYCLMIDNKLSDTASSRELIAIQEKDQTRWLIGLIKWRKTTQDKVVMGVELVSSEAAPCLVSPVTKVASSQSFNPAILTSATDKPSPVLFCNEVLQNSRKFFLKTDGEIRRCLTKQVSRQDPELSMITFRVLEEPVLTL